MLSDLLHLDARASNLVHERARAQAMALKHTTLNLPCGHGSSSSSPDRGTCHELMHDPVHKLVRNCANRTQPLNAAAREAISLVLSVPRRNAPLDTALVPKPQT